MEIDIGYDPFIKATTSSFSECSLCHRFLSSVDVCECSRGKTTEEFNDLTIKKLDLISGLRGQIGIRRRKDDDSWCLIIRIPFGKSDEGLKTASKINKKILEQNGW